MKVIDLTHFISEDMPVYPGTEGPKFKPANSYEVDGFKETLMTMYTHTGTHMDPPAHLFAGRTTLDQFPITQFVGKALVVDCSDLKEGQRITMDSISKNKDKADQAEFILFRLGWDKYWGTEQYFGDYPYIDDEVVDFLIKGNKKGVGLDVIGIDPIPDENLPIHKRLFKENEIVVIENLMNLDLVGSDLFIFCALPLKHIDADGSPIRAIAILD
ncbi:cyclase family protein [Sinanaerobacter chloroacetimidivorans]|jgi:kynurenine formamidase|uniref:Cyclase family protein n=1 Tax=Sinanaerobacter chloroacetimidivorans TaxID=2818044 RepID=A0A8J7W1R8_9FIRM|nr:cyclase family protein [Sinanaerobacter chloroacetimidivorans]MBR0598834.1 cyclase family protein [Sinanaerobacter chloroacetimidivorans]